MLLLPTAILPADAEQGKIPSLEKMAQDIALPQLAQQIVAEKDWEAISSVPIEHRSEIITLAGKAAAKEIKKKRIRDPKKFWGDVTPSDNISNLKGTTICHLKLLLKDPARYAHTYSMFNAFLDNAIGQKAKTRLSYRGGPLSERGKAEHDQLTRNREEYISDRCQYTIQDLKEHNLLPDVAYENLSIYPKKFRLKSLAGLSEIPDIQSVEFLSILGHNIPRIDIDTFASTPNLKEINLSNDNIQSIDPAAINNLRQLRTLILENNPNIPKEQIKKIKEQNPNLTIFWESSDDL